MNQTVLIEKMNSVDDYVNVYKDRYLIENGTQLNFDVIVEDIGGWERRWLGFRTYIDDIMGHAFLGDIAINDMYYVFEQYPREEWSNLLISQTAQRLGRISFSMSMLMEHLRERERHEKLGDILEEIAYAEGDYQGVLESIDSEAEKRYMESRPCLHEFTVAFFEQMFIDHMSDEAKEKQKEILERGDIDNR